MNVTPPPWTLFGDGFISVFRPAKALLLEHNLVPEGLRESFLGGPALVMLVRYRHSNVGPYNELLFIPGFFRHEGRRYPSVSRIVVSSEASAVSGRTNWALPKEVADFAVQEEGEELELSVTQSGVPLFRGRYRAGNMKLAVGAGIVPRPWRTLFQVQTGATLFTTIEGSGHALNCSLLEQTFSGDLAVLNEVQRLLTVKVENFTLRFPHPSSSPPTR